MVARSAVAGIVVLVIAIVLAVAAVLGLEVFPQLVAPASNLTSKTTNETVTNATTASGTPTIAPPTPILSGQQITVSRGQTFTVRLPANPSTGYQWKPTFNTGALSLRGQTFVSNATSTRVVGAGGTELFTFQALRTSATGVTFDSVSPGGQTTQSTSYTIIIR